MGTITCIPCIPSLKHLSRILTHFGLKEGDLVSALHQSGSDHNYSGTVRNPGRTGLALASGNFMYTSITAPSLPMLTINPMDDSTWNPFPKPKEQTASCSPTPEATQGPPPMKTIARSVIALKAAPTEKNPDATVEITLEGPTLLNEDNNKLAPSAQDWIMNNITLIKEKGAIPGTIQIQTCSCGTAHLQDT